MNVSASNLKDVVTIQDQKLSVVNGNYVCTINGGGGGGGEGTYFYETKKKCRDNLYSKK